MAFVMYPPTDSYARFYVAIQSPSLKKRGLGEILLKVMQYQQIHPCTLDPGGPCRDDGLNDLNCV